MSRVSSRCQSRGRCRRRRVRDDCRARPHAHAGGRGVEAFGEQAGKEARHVLHDEDGQREAGGNFGEQEFESSGAAGGGPNDDHLWRQRHRGGRVSRGSGEGIAADGRAFEGKRARILGSSSRVRVSTPSRMPFCAPGLAT